MCIRIFDRSLTLENIVVHDVDPIQDGSKGGDVLHRVTVGICERDVLSSSSNARCARERGTKELEHGEKVHTVLGTNDVISRALDPRIFPINVDAIEIVLLVQRNNVVDKSLPGGRSRTSRGEISIGTVSVKSSGVQGVKSYLLPLQPPMLTLTLVPLACAADTNRLSISGDEEGSSKANLNFWSGITKAKSIQSKRVMSMFSGGRVAETQSG